MVDALSLQELARQVRQDTIIILEKVPDAALLWAPQGTANTILWHAGHALWLQDLMCIRVLGGQSRLPEHWEERFGQGSRPADVRRWPARAELLAYLREQLAEMLQHLGSVTQEQLEEYPAHLSSHRTALGWIVHGLHDEAKHCGEMYLLWKLWVRSAKARS